MTQRKKITLHTKRVRETNAPEKKAFLNLLRREYNVTGRKARIENGQPRITPVAATATAAACMLKRNSAEERDMVYIDKELGKKPAWREQLEVETITGQKEIWQHE